MDDVLTTQFERVEKALSSLVESIATYNPSPQAALDLVAADDHLAHGLDQRTCHWNSLRGPFIYNSTVARHQANHARIQLLRAEAEGLEEQLKSSVEKLATLRHDLFDTPATIFPEHSRPVPFDELLQYASNISKHTVPPTYRERVPGPAGNQDKDREEANSSGALTNGVNTPAIQPEVPETAVALIEGQKNDESAAGAAPEITEEEAEWLKKLNQSQLSWYPWPSNDKIRQSSLYKIQAFREQNYDLNTFSIPAHEEAKRLKRLKRLQQALGQGSPEPQAEEVQPGIEAVQTIRRPVAQPTNIFDDMDDD
ncbi:hypothetical protein LEMA_P009550.1 [Plenodomus lingam JN3]|uniref:Mediator of RNA polymerase II transcription subunit 4 n=1 Tax=Leptosphaeria maculans (strain JN3 / isolate v23.1.3 / race Av1-4-5-6-7-8) TaxID=985895 RepID=E5ACG6_LEPMJ|nr:hypothetical protein LEMA_P009550.1 [Plenodomus lingam JN3]CBY02168.1 hypothetical protein LEMA_P009550.1 [Plenodomus lingam JN3]